MEDLFKIVCELPTWVIVLTLVGTICFLPILEFNFTLFGLISILAMVLIANVAAKFMK
jgi:hypothetical protein